MTRNAEGEYRLDDVLEAASESERKQLFREMRAYRTAEDKFYAVSKALKRGLVKK